MGEAEGDGSAPRCVWLTGASSGIGAAIREHLTSLGHHVVGLSRQPGEASERYHPVVVDFAEVNDLDRQISEALHSQSNLPQPDALVLNAAAPLFGTLEQLSASDVTRNLQTNLLAPLLLTRRLLPTLKKQPHANIVFIGSESAFRAGPQGTVYCAAKFGLRGFADALRQECTKGSGVAVTSIHPGVVRTPWFDDLHFEPGEEEENALRPEEVATVVAQVLEVRPGAVVEEVRLAPLKRVVRSRQR